MEGVPGAPQREAVRCRPGTVTVRGGPGSAAHRFAAQSSLRRLRILVYAASRCTASGTREYYRRLPALALARGRAAAGFARVAAAARGRAEAALPVTIGRPLAAHMASAFCRRTLQYSQARSMPRVPILWPPVFSVSPGVSGPGVPIAIARSCSSALWVV